MDVDDEEPQDDVRSAYACDIRDQDDPNMVVEYIDELYKYYKECEVRGRLRGGKACGNASRI